MHQNVRNRALLVGALCALSSFDRALAQTNRPYELVLYGPEEIVWQHGQSGLFNLPDGPISYRMFGDEIRMWFVASVGTVVIRGKAGIEAAVTQAAGKDYRQLAVTGYRAELVK